MNSHELTAYLTTFKLFKLNELWPYTKLIKYSKKY